MTGPGLAALQRQIQQAILQPAETPSLPWIASPDSRQRLAIYCNAYRLRLIDALAVDYPMLSSWLGEQSFSRLSWDYFRAFPSHYRSIRWVGRDLPRFLQAAPDYQARPQLAEMAQFEWTLGLAFDAGDGEPLATEDLTRIDPQSWPGLRLSLHPSVHRLRLWFPVPKVWKALQEGGPLPQCRPREEPTDWLIWRYDLRIFFRSLTAAEAEALTGVQQGENFATICERLSHHTDPVNAAERAAWLLQQWLNEGLIVKAETGDP